MFKKRNTIFKLPHNCNRMESKTQYKAHATKKLKPEKLENRYDIRFCYSTIQISDLIAFDKESIDKRKIKTILN